MIDIDALHRFFICDADRGRLVWRERPLGDFLGTDGRTAKHRCNHWNARFAGQMALNNLSPAGYKRGNFQGVGLQAHRVIWAMTHGEWPDQIDHINGNRSDNRIANLRAVGNWHNARNKAVRKDSKSGVCGVEFLTHVGRWRAYIRDSDRKKSHLGCFDSLEEAAAVRRAAQQRLGFHENHGTRKSTY